MEPDKEKLNLLILNYNQDKIIEAKKIAEKLLKEFPDSSLLNNIFGVINYRTNNNLNAIKYFKRAIKISPNKVDAYNNIGIAYNEIGDLEKAISNYKAAIKLKPDYAEAYNNLANSEKEIGDFNEAIKNYKKAIKFRNNYPDAYFNLGLIYQNFKNYEKSVFFFNEALKFSPKDNGTIKNIKSYLLKSHYELGNKKNFISCLIDLINLGEKNSMIGSFCSKGNIKFNIDIKNPFCNLPLNYVYHESLKNNCDFEEIFRKPIIKFLDHRKISNKEQKLLSNGYQTSGNIFLNNNNIFIEVKKIIEAELKKYIQKFKNSNEGFIHNWPSSYTLYGWLVSYENNGLILPHIHERGLVSGSVYINVPKKMNKHDGGLFLNLTDDIYTKNYNFKSSQLMDVETASICLFPSSLNHSSLPFESSEKRIVLAFDVIPNF